MVTAGNPPEYNNSVREFDIVTWDRLKRIDVEPDYAVWKKYAYQKSVHPAILTYLDTKKTDFYKIETTIDGKSFVTARGWSDLSDMIRIYNQNKLTVDELLIAQYLQNKTIAKNFAVYYDLFQKYRSDYQIPTILAGQASENIKHRAKVARFDERLALLGLLLDGINTELLEITPFEKSHLELLSILKQVRVALDKPAAAPYALLEKQKKALSGKIAMGKRASTLSSEDEYVLHSVIAVLSGMQQALKMEDITSPKAAFAVMKEQFDLRTTQLKQKAEAAGNHLSNVFRFCEDVFGDGQELLILVTELTAGQASAAFINRYGCKEYFAHNKELLFYERQIEIMKDIETLEWEDYSNEE